MVRHLATALIGLSVLAAATPALAIEDWLFGNRLNVPRDQWLSPTDVVEKLSAKGFKVVEIEADDGAYEVEMPDENGTAPASKPTSTPLRRSFFTATTTNCQERALS